MNKDTKKDDLISPGDTNRRTALLSNRRGRSHFSHVKAAGGVVFDSSGRVLMIFRRGVWDLPKGHLEKGETLRECAAREVCEECGLNATALIVHDTIAETEHFSKHDELKHTTWFRMTYTGDPSQATPQTSEDIERLQWFTLSEALEKAQASYDTIRQIIENL